MARNCLYMPFNYTSPLKLLNLPYQLGGGGGGGGGGKRGGIRSGFSRPPSWLIDLPPNCYLLRVSSSNTGEQTLRPVKLRTGFTSTETVRLIRDGEPQDGHLDFQNVQSRVIPLGRLKYEHPFCDTCVGLAGAVTNSKHWYTTSFLQPLPP